MLSKGNLFIKNLGCTIRTLHNKAVVIGNVQNTKCSTYQVRTILYICVYIHFIYKQNIARFNSLNLSFSINITLLI